MCINIDTLVEHLCIFMFYVAPDIFLWIRPAFVVEEDQMCRSECSFFYSRSGTWVEALTFRELVGKFRYMKEAAFEWIQTYSDEGQVIVGQRPLQLGHGGPLPGYSCLKVSWIGTIFKMVYLNQSESHGNYNIHGYSCKTGRKLYCLLQMYTSSCPLVENLAVMDLHCGQYTPRLKTTILNLIWMRLSKFYDVTVIYRLNS